MTAKQALRVVAASRGTMREIAKDLLAALTSQPVADVADFYRGFAYGIECQRKWSTSGGAPNPTWRVYMTLWQNWQRVERMASTTELCDWLTAQLDGNIVGSDPRRIQKICERIGLKLRARGRPSRK
ncbi:MAG: hypothetical protein HZA91_11595 [Verrucomicrobia bacterium]|nr:hypothetical protein [Verrucomicrobiota bacterium]